MPQLVTAAFPIVQSTTGVATAKPVQFLPAPLFDFELGDFVTDASGKIVMADGYTAWKQWCIKTLMTQSAAYAIYPRMHGMDISVVFANRPHAVIESDLTHRVRYALTRTVRTVDVIDFVFDWTQTYTVSFECTPVPAAGAPFKLPGQFPPNQPASVVSPTPSPTPSPSPSPAPTGVAAVYGHGIYGVDYYGDPH